jgi:holo-[acyl-carrier protein] synthase
MAIFGTGVDVVEIPRIRRMLERHGDRFLKRVYTGDEISYCLQAVDPAPRLAARFAAKEAAVKALGLGFSEGIGYADVEVTRGERGQPRLRWHGRAADWIELRMIMHSHLSISHGEEIAIAQVVLETA